MPLIKCRISVCDRYTRVDKDVIDAGGVNERGNLCFSCYKLTEEYKNAARVRRNARTNKLDNILQHLAVIMQHIAPAGETEADSDEETN